LIVINYVALDYCDPVIAASLLLINGGFLLALGLGLARSLGMSAARRIAQLLLEALFTSVSPLWTGLAVVVILLFAGCEAMVRPKDRLKGFGLLDLVPAR
jgi:ABC-type iron transport system FetAB permease component